MTIKEVRAIMMLYDYLGFDTESVNDDIKRGYLSENTGRDHNDYMWYSDETHNACINIDTLDIIEDDNRIDELLG